MPESWIVSLIVAAGVMLIVLRRAKRLFTRQKFSLPRLVLRIGVIGSVCAMLLVVFTLSKGLAPVAGLGVGAALGLLGAYLTRFESVGGEVYYTPNGYLGLAVFSLFIGRLGYRLTRIGAVSDSVASRGGGFPAGFDRLTNSPWTAAMLFVLLGYFLCYFATVLVRGRILSA